MLSTVFIALIGALTIFVSGFWTSIAQPKHRCRDTITLVKGRLDNAACDFDQGISYMQDLTGDHYVVCRCRVNQINDEEEQVLRPEVPGFLLEPPIDEAIPRVESSPDKGTLL